MARPQINDNDRRTIQVNIRLTEAENATVLIYAQASGMSPANWIRTLVFTRKFPPMKLSLVDAALYRELKKIGVNLNQVTHKINRGEFPKEYFDRQVELTATLNRVLNALTNDGQPDQG